jgi:glutaminyl-peptide cyclotransferase
MRLRSLLLVILLIVASLSALAAGDRPQPDLTPTLAPTRVVTATPTAQPELTLFVPNVIESYPHDTDSFTQGLVFNGETFYESAGLYGESDLREVDIETGEVLRQVDVPAEFFAEGLALVNDRLIQITWQENIAFVYNAETFEQVGTFEYETEGWGLCYDGDVLYMSDGTPTLYTRDPETFELLAEVLITFQGETVGNLNELECVDGAVWGNIWQTDFIVRIDPATGVINGIVNAVALLTPEEVLELASGAVLNGIAYDPDEAVFYITGKKWPRIFKVTFEEFQP